jgi:sugar phosphate isomerase/epimerase
VDEVELLFFESKSEDCMPSREEIEALSRISKEFSLDYNIHLPTDVSLAAPNRAGRNEALDALGRVIDMTRELDPSSWTLNIPWDLSKRTGTEIERWRERARAGLEKLLGSGIPSRRLAVENLDYPFGWVRDLILELDLSVCMDVGHLRVRKQNIAAFYRKNADRIPILHLHGVRDGKDHLPLTVFSKSNETPIANILKDFSGTLSVEVFSYDHVAASLLWLEKMMG